MTNDKKYNPNEYMRLSQARKEGIVDKIKMWDPLWLTRALTNPTALNQPYNELKRYYRRHRGVSRVVEWLFSTSLHGLLISVVPFIIINTAIYVAIISIEWKYTPRADVVALWSIIAISPAYAAMGYIASVCGRFLVICIPCNIVQYDVNGRVIATFFLWVYRMPFMDRVRDDGTPWLTASKAIWGVREKLDLWTTTDVSRMDISCIYNENLFLPRVRATVPEHLTPHYYIKTFRINGDIVVDKKTRPLRLREAVSIIVVPFAVGLMTIVAQIASVLIPWW